MREPTRDEMQIAIILLEEMTLSADARAVLNRIFAGEPVQMEGLVLMRSLGETLIRQRTGNTGTQSG